MVDAGQRIAAAAPGRAAELLARLHGDDAADLLSAMGAERRAAVTAALPEVHRRRIGALLGDEPATAGALMSPRFLALYPDVTIGEALDRVCCSGGDDASLTVVFVANAARRLCGVVALRALLRAPADEPIGIGHGCRAGGTSRVRAV